jgi:hypothetical protein
MNYCHFDEKKQLNKNAREIIFVVTEKGCHECQSHRIDRDGYPRIDRFCKEWLMSRYMWTLIKGEIPVKQVVRHKCDNPSCINIDHLELGTQKENMADKKLRGKVSKKGKKLNDKERLEIIKDTKRSIKKLALDYGVSHATIISLRKRRTMRKKINRAPNKPSVMGNKNKTKLQEIKQSSNK